MKFSPGSLGVLALVSLIGCGTNDGLQRQGTEHGDDTDSGSGSGPGPDSGSGSGSDPKPDGCDGTTIDVSLVEFSVTATPASAAAGHIVFQVHNDSADTQHEFLVVRTDLTIPQLPTNADGSFNEECDSAKVVDSIEEIPGHETRMLTLDLAAGHYVLLCNRVEIEPDGEVESHFAEGMHTDFNVL